MLARMSSPTPPVDLVTSPEAGRMINRSPRTVHRLVEAGQLIPAARLSGPNGAMLFHRADVEALAAERSPKISA